MGILLLQTILAVELTLSELTVLALHARSGDRRLYASDYGDGLNWLQNVMRTKAVLAEYSLRRASCGCICGYGEVVTSCCS